jgi:predicted metal-dependent peptidase
MYESIESLKWRVANVFPSNDLSLDHLLGMFKMTYSNKVETAAAKTGLPPVLLFNKKFVKKFCKTDEHLLMLVMHEMYHILLGHTRLFIRVTQAQNFAFDAIINSMICNSMSDYDYTSFFSQLYADDDFTALLRPPKNWNPENDSKADWKLKGDLLQAHKALYTSDGDITYKDIFDLVSREIDENIEIILIGDHSEDDDEHPSSSQITNAIAKIVAKWPAMDITQGRDMGMSAAIQEILLEAPNKKIANIIQKAIRYAALTNEGTVNRKALIETDTMFPYPTLPDRKATVMKSIGQPTLFYRGKIERMTNKPVGRAHLYLDVSGSMDMVLEKIFSGLLPIRQLIHPIVHIFSTEIYDYPLSKILKGHYKSTFGTDIDCVLEHIINNNVKKPVIITDGYVGEPSQLLVSKLPRKIKFVKVITEDGFENEMQLLSGPVFSLPSIGEYYE